MPADIQYEDNLPLFVSRSKPAWWGAGRKTYAVDDKVTLSQATIDAGADTQIVLEPLSSRHGDVDDVVGVYIAPHGSVIEYTYLGHVSPDYELLQNLEIAQVYDKLSERWPVETMGVLGKGEKTFWCLKAPDWDVKGDTMKTFFVVLDDKLAKQRLKEFITPVRAECANTIRLGLQRAELVLDFIHKKGLRQKLQMSADIIQQMIQQQEMVKELFGNLADTKMNLKEFADKVLSQLYPNKEEGTEDQVLVNGIAVEMPINVSAPSRDNLLVQQLFTQFNDTVAIPALKNTKWGGLAAITKMEDWDRPSKGKQVPAKGLLDKRAQTKMLGLDLLIKA